MFAPTRLFFALRHRADAGLIAAAVAVSVLFAATPFLIPAVSEDFSVSLGRSGLLSAAQVGGFAVVAFVAGRRLRTDRRYLVGGSLAAVVLHLLSIVAPNFEVLLLLRILAGGSAGLLVWLAWANAMRSSGALRTVAATGPLTVLIAAPILSMLANAGGANAVFVTMAATSLPPALLPAEFAGFRKERSRMSPSTSNIVLVVALGLATMTGSALFVFGATIGERQFGLDPFVVSIAYSGNALTGLIAARRPAVDRPGSVWIFGMAAAAAAIAFGETPLLFVGGLAAWGFCFWMAIPTILRSIAAWSLAPDERVGDAQSSMALGRAIGPAIAAAFVGDGSFTGVGVFTVVGLTVTGAIVLAVRLYRRNHEPPVGTVARRGPLP